MRKLLFIVAIAAALGAQTPQTGRGGKKGQPQNKVSPLETPVATFHGTLRSLSKKEVVLEVGEEQSIAFHISSKTKFFRDAKPIKPAAIAQGASVTVEGKRDLLGNVDAVTVTVDTKPAPKPAP